MKFTNERPKSGEGQRRGIARKKKLPLLVTLLAVLALVTCCAIIPSNAIQIGGTGTSGGGGWGSGSIRVNSGGQNTIWFDESVTNPPQGWGDDSINWFYNKLNDELQFRDYTSSMAGGNSIAFLKNAGKGAITEAINATSGATKARIVGVSVAWTHEYGTSDTAGLWFKSKSDFANSVVYPDDTGLPASLGWEDDSGDGTTWRQHIYNQGKSAQLNSSATGITIWWYAVNNLQVQPKKSISGYTNVSTSSMKADSSSAVHDTMHLSAENISGNAEVSFRLRYNSTLNFTGEDVTKKSETKSSSGSVNGTVDSPDFYPSDIDSSWTTWEPGTYWFTAWATADGQSGGSSANVDTERFVVTAPNYTPTSTTLTVTKSLSGEDLRSGQFTFDLYENGSRIDSATNDSSGNVSFKVSYNSKSDVGTHTYTIRENTSGSSKYTYDTHAVTVTVKVTESNYRLSASTPSYSENRTFYNARIPDLEGTSTQLHVTKVLQKDTLQNRQFSFALKENGRTIQTAYNDASGNVSFSLSYNSLSDVGTHTYTITESKGSDEYITYDTHSVTATVTVTQSTRSGSNGTTVYVLSASSPSYSGGTTTFTNVHGQKGSIQLHARKYYTDGKLTNGAFTFELLDSNGNVIDTRTNDANGLVTFKTLNFTDDDIGNHTYSIREKIGTNEAIAYDTNIHQVTVNVGESDTPILKMSSSPAISTFNGTTINAEFTNAVQATTGKVEIKGTKKMVGRDLFGDDFTFELKDELGNTVAQAKNDTNGNFSFTYELTRADLGKTRTLTVSEKKGDNRWMTYDTHVDTIILTNIHDERQSDASHIIVADVNYDSDGVTFTNTMPPMATTGSDSSDMRPAIIGGSVAGVIALGLITFGIKHGRNKNVR